MDGSDEDFGYELLPTEFPPECLDHHNSSTFKTVEFLHTYK